ncbi:MAG TPA: hypothetical protein ACFYD3_09930 [Candidatus Hypogeohydataceae bacterium YC41]
MDLKHGFTPLDKTKSSKRTGIPIKAVGNITSGMTVAIGLIFIAIGASMLMCCTKATGVLLV